MLKLIRIYNGWFTEDKFTSNFKVKYKKFIISIIILSLLVSRNKIKQGTIPVFILSKKDDDLIL